MSSIATRRRHRNQRGYALLLIFMMAAAVALMLYMQLPREAFESERDKEQMLIDRGDRYKRAIYLYYVSNNRTWPAKMEDLESFNNHRYLARRYTDPFTGKNEWRLIHTNGAFLTDSLVTPPPAQPGPTTPGANGPGGTTVAGANPSGGLGTFGTPTGAPQFSSTPADPNAPQVNAQVLRRPSDQPLAQNSNYQNQPTPGANGDPGYQPFNPSSLPPITMYPNGYNAGTNTPGMPGANQLGPNQPGLNQPGLNQPGLNQPGLNQPGLPPGANQFVNPAGVNQNGLNQNGLNPNGQSAPGVPGFTLPGTNIPVTNPGVMPPTLNFNQPGFNQPAVNNQNQNAANGTINLSTSVGQPVQNPGGFGQPLQQPQGFNPAGPAANPAANQAVGLINQLLTTPRQPPPGIGPAQSQGSGGLAGVASTYKGISIKAYGDRTKYQEWEFVFQLSQLTTGLQAPTAAGLNGPNANGQTPNGMPGTQGATPPGQAPASPFGAPGQFGAPSPFGAPGQPAPQQQSPPNSPGFILTP